MLLNLLFGYWSLKQLVKGTSRLLAPKASILDDSLCKIMMVLCHHMDPKNFPYRPFIRLLLVSLEINKEL